MSKKVAPTIIVILMSLYILAYVIVLVTGMLSDAPFALSLIMGVIAVMALIAIGALLYTLSERLKEIDKEDEDDLSKY